MGVTFDEDGREGNGTSDWQPGLSYLPDRGDTMIKKVVHPDVLAEMNKEFLINDLTRALKSMKNNKSPGVDGLPKKFYEKIWEELRETMLKMFKESFSLGVLPPTLREGIVSLLFKKGDKADLKNWRPLSLLDKVLIGY